MLMWTIDLYNLYNSMPIEFSFKNNIKTMKYKRKAQHTLKKKQTQT